MTNMAVSKQIKDKEAIFLQVMILTDIDIGLNQTKTKLSKVLHESITGKAIVNSSW